MVLFREELKDHLYTLLLIVILFWLGFVCLQSPQEKENLVVLLYEKREREREKANKLTKVEENNFICSILTKILIWSWASGLGGIISQQVEGWSAWWKAQWWGSGKKNKERKMFNQLKSVSPVQPCKMRLQSIYCSNKYHQEITRLSK